MATADYQERRAAIEDYFDRTAADVWARLTSEEPVSGIRETVRRGREQMRNLLLSWLPDDLGGKTVLDAGCGTGVIAIELAHRGAQVVAVDLSRSLIELARDRYADLPEYQRIEFVVGDMRAIDDRRYDHVLAMDSIIHYEAAHGVQTIERLAASVAESMVFTFAPKTAPLAAMHAIGKLFPRGDRSPAIEPVSPRQLSERLSKSRALFDWRQGRTERVSSGFYTSQAMELIKL